MEIQAITSGLFSDGLASGIGIESGIILTSGKAVDAVGPNHNLMELYADGDATDDTGLDLELPGDTDLDLLSAYDTFDA